MAGNALLDLLQGASNAAASNVSGPVDLLAWALRKAGVPVPEDAVLSSKWMADRGLTREPTNKLAGLAGETLGMISPIAAGAYAPQIAKGAIKGQKAVADALYGVGEKASNMAGDYLVATGQIAPATVWHGSPHKFDKFDSSKIGTGEGAQAYGHGLYLADAPEVANAYQYNLGYKSGNMPKIGGMDIGDFYTKLQDRANRLPPAMATKEYDKLAMLEDLMGEQSSPEKVLANAAAREYPQHAIDWFKSQIAPKYESPGNLYKVDLPDSAIARMLDWDKPLADQPANVAEMLNRAGMYDEMSGMTGEGIWKKLVGKQTAPMQGWDLQTQGSRIAHNRSAPARTAEQLASDFGIPGIRYLDGGSRGAGAGTSNYVVFPGEENMLTILERNGVPLNALQEAARGR